MVTIDVSKKDLENLVGKKFTGEELEKTLLFVKGEIDASDCDKLKLDIKDTNRPDLWSVEGIARELRARIGMEKGLPKLKAQKGKTRVIVKESVKGTRPYIVGAVIRNVRITDEFLEQLIQLQEKVGISYGKKRKEVGLGLYDFDKIKEPIYYVGFKPRELKYQPLEFDRELFLDDILELHQKGKEYGHLIKGYEYYPIVIDSANNVCSMPPIINSEYTGKVTQDTKNIFIESTGFQKKYVNTALNIMTAAFLERGCIVEQVNIIDGKEKYSTPNYAAKKAKVNLDTIRKIVGLKISNAEIKKLLERSRYNVKVKGNTAYVEYASYRQDILHEMDIIEDVIMSLGYNELELDPIRMHTFGALREDTILVEDIAELCVGLGLQEILTFTLTSLEKQVNKVGLEKEKLVEIANPMSSEWAVFRKSLIPEILDFLGKNKNTEYPQNVFEIGKALSIDESLETKVKEMLCLTIVLCGKNAEFNELKRYLDAIAEHMGWKYSVKKVEHNTFKKGMVAALAFEDGRKGIIGELNQKIAKNFGLGQEIAILEIELASNKNSNY
ncbi:MAG: phenylalanine--tRNA ligase subunit beta [archaeon]